MFQYSDGLCHFSDKVLNNSSERSEESVNISKMVMLTLSDSSLRLRMTETSCNSFTCEN